MMGPLEMQIIASSRIADHDRMVEALYRVRQAETGQQRSARAATHPSALGQLAALARRFTLRTPVLHNGHVRG